ncbi:unnamed protein product [Rotaria sp. Silwood2]|nr:unnamed protein product [Rotaria sp. Silwood2]
MSTVDITTSSNISTVTKEQKDSVPSINDILSSEEESEDDEDLSTSIPVIRRRKQNLLKLKGDNQQLLPKVSIDNISGEAKAVLIALPQCKKISRLNKEIERNGGVTVHQTIKIRWLSIMESLESILKSFKIIKKILINKQQQKLLIHVNDKTINQLLLLLKIFQDVIKLIQVRNSPSLHMVLLCIQTLRDVLKSYESLVNYDNSRDNCELEQLGETGDDLLEQLEDVTFFLHRIRNLLNEMLILEVRHYGATALHPKYRNFIKRTKFKTNKGKTVTKFKGNRFRR